MILKQMKSILDFFFVIIIYYKEKVIDLMLYYILKNKNQNYESNNIEKEIINLLNNFNDKSDYFNLYCMDYDNKIDFDILKYVDNNINLNNFNSIYDYFEINDIEHQKRFKDLIYLLIFNFDFKNVLKFNELEFTS